MISVVGLSIYPIKSCRGVTLNEARLVSGGIDGDRRFMVVDEYGAALTARVEPRLVLVTPSFVGDKMRLEAPSCPPLEIQRMYVAPPGQQIATKIWRDEVSAWEIQEGSLWFSQFLKKKVRLVYQADPALRQVNPERSQLGDMVSLADAYPLLLANTASLIELNTQTSEPVTMDRFRPNLVVEGARAYEEDVWEELRIGEIEFVSPKLCDRCVFTTVDPQTAERGREPLRALAKHRRWDNAVWFATNLIPRNLGILRLGDEISPLKVRSHPRDSV
jgi:uncharacterized protein